MIAKGAINHKEGTMKKLIAALGLIASLTGCGLNLTHTPHQAATPTPAPMATIHTTNTPTHCTEDMPCWNCHTMGNHQCGARVPAWVSCNKIDGSEFPRQARVAWEDCYRDINDHHAVWHYRPHVEGKQGAWCVVGPTSVCVTRNGWWVTS